MGKLNIPELLQQKGKLVEEMRKKQDGIDERGVETAEEMAQMDKMEQDCRALEHRIEREKRLQEQEGKEAKELDDKRKSGDIRMWEGIHIPVLGQRQPSFNEVDLHATNLLQAYLRCAKSNPVIEQRHHDAAAALNQDFRQREIFIPLMKNYRQFQRESQLEVRALNVATGTKGQETIPEGFVRSLEVAEITYGGMRMVSDVIRTDGVGDLPIPTVNDTANKAVILAEATDFGASVDPSFAQVVLKAFKYSSKPVLVSTELLQDSAFDLGARIGEMLGIRIARGQNEHFTTGAGTTLPKGVLVAGTAVNAADDVTISADDVITLIHSVDPAYRNNARFMMHDAILAKIRLLKENTTNAFIWQPGLQAGVPDRLAGYPFTINQDFPSVVEADAKVMAFGDFSKYKIRDAATLRLIRLDELYAATDQVAFIAYQRSDGNLVDAGTNPVKYLQMLGS